MAVGEVAGVKVGRRIRGFLLAAEVTLSGVLLEVGGIIEQALPRGRG
jgi:hypothetical protein